MRSLTYHDDGVGDKFQSLNSTGVSGNFRQ